MAQVGQLEGKCTERLVRSRAAPEGGLVWFGALCTGGGGAAAHSPGTTAGRMGKQGREGVARQWDREGAIRGARSWLGKGRRKSERPGRRGQGTPLVL